VRERASARMVELRARFATSRRNVAIQDSVRAERQRQPLARRLSDFAGAYEEPSFGTVRFSCVTDGWSIGGVLSMVRPRYTMRRSRSCASRLLVPATS
jgi:hypothetical protein